MNYYEDIYLKRLNRYGLNYQSRVQNQRKRDFDLYLQKTVYYVNFSLDGTRQEGSHEPYSQDNTQTLTLLLTKTSLNIPNGTIIFLPDKDNILKPWMVYWMQIIVGKGYNSYILLRMTKEISWKDRTNTTRTTWAYLFGKEDSTLKNEIKSNTSKTVYSENSNSNFFIIPTNSYLKRDDYLTVGTGSLQEAFRVTGYDIQSTEGVEYVTIDPVLIADTTPPPVVKVGDDPEDFFWLTGEGGNK